MRILATDTTTSILSVAVTEDSRILAETIVECHRSHSERLLETVAWVLHEASLELADMDALAISTGPGSFTGLRVGIAAWKGLAFSGGTAGKNLPLIPVPTLDAMTRLGVFTEGVACPVLDARMGEVFGAVYRFHKGAREKLTPDCVCPVERLLEGMNGPVLFIGNGAELYRDRILAQVPDAIFAPAPCSVPRAAAVALEAEYAYAQGVCTDPALVAPVYLRKSQPEQKQENPSA